MLNFLYKKASTYCDKGLSKKIPKTIEEAFKNYKKVYLKKTKNSSYQKTS